MWSQLLRFSQLSQSTTIAATPITIVAKNHNCRNCNNNCCNLINHQFHNCNHNCCIFFRKMLQSCKFISKIEGWCFLVHYQYRLYFSQYCRYFALLTLQSYNWCAESKCGQFCARPWLHHNFCNFCGKEKHSKNEICNWLDLYWRKACSSILQLRMSLTAVIQIYAKNIIMIIQMNKYACAGN